MPSVGLPGSKPKAEPDNDEDTYRLGDVYRGPDPADLCPPVPKVLTEETVDELAVPVPTPKDPIAQVPNPIAAPPSLSRLLLLLLHFPCLELSEPTEGVLLLLWLLM